MRRSDAQRKGNRRARVIAGLGQKQDIFRVNPNLPNGIHQSSIGTTIYLQVDRLSVGL